MQRLDQDNSNQAILPSETTVESTNTSNIPEIITPAPDITPSRAFDLLKFNLAKPIIDHFPDTAKYLSLLKAHIKALESSKKPEDKETQKFIDSLKALLNELQSTSHDDEDVAHFLVHTVWMLDNLKNNQSHYQQAIDLFKNSKLNSELHLKLAAELISNQMQVISYYEHHCKPPEQLSLNAKIIMSVIFTAVFAVFGFIIGAIVGFAIGGGAVSALTSLLGVYQGTQTGVAIGAGISTLLFGSATYAACHHLLFTKPRELLTSRRAVSVAAEVKYSAEHNQELCRIQGVDSIDTLMTPAPTT